MYKQIKNILKSVLKLLSEITEIDIYSKNIFFIVSDSQTDSYQFV